jgi:hypothetical protein
MSDQQVAEAIELRRKADVLYVGDEPVADVTAKADPQSLLTDGIDLQLEAGVLVLQTRLLTGQRAVAQREQMATTP